MNIADRSMLNAKQDVNIKINLFEAACHVLFIVHFAPYAFYLALINS